MNLSGMYEMDLPLPGHNRICNMSLEQTGGLIKGALYNPYVPGEKCPITGTCSAEGNIDITTLVGRTAYIFSGKASEEQILTLALTTKETIELEPGRRVSGRSGQLAGEYVVGVYSPGGVKENHMVLETSNQQITGEMFCLVDEKFLKQMEQMQFGLGPGPVPGPESGMPGPQGKPPMMEMKPPKLGDKNDLNAITAGEGTSEAFWVQTKTAQGSLFQFEGHIDGDLIYLTMNVTDQSDGIIARKVQ